MVQWPPTLEALKRDQEIDENDTRDDVSLQTMLDAAVAFVQDVRPRINYTSDPLSELPEPEPDLVLGTIRLAGRWYTRRRSPEGLVSAGDMGTARVPAVDSDIAKMLRIGRWGKGLVA